MQKQMNNYQSSTKKQLTLISTHALRLAFQSQQKLKIIYQVEKQGILFLRKLAHKKVNFNHKMRQLRIIYTIYQNQQKCHQLPQKCDQLHQIGQQYSEKLTISCDSKQLEKNIIVLFLNHYNVKQKTSKLLIFGYLIASVMIIYEQNFENEGDNSTNQIFSKLKDSVKQINFETLNKQKCRKDCTLQPKFAFLSFEQMEQFKEQQDVKQYFCQMIDLSHQKDFTSIQHKLIERVKEQKIMGRQIQNYEFTTQSLENLLYQICEHFNNDDKVSFDLNKVYEKIILNMKQILKRQCVKNHKQQLLSEIFQKQYDNTSLENLDNLKKLQSIFPLPKGELCKILQRTKRKTQQIFNQSAIACMNIDEYSQMLKQLNKVLQQIQQVLITINNQKSHEFVEECSKILSDQLSEIKVNQDQNVQLIFQLLNNKVQCFNSQCINNLTEQDQHYMNQKLLQLMKCYNKQVGQVIINCLQKIKNDLKASENEVQKQRIQIKKLKMQKKKIQDQYAIQLSVSEQYKSKLKQYITNSNQECFSLLMDQKNSFKKYDNNYKQIRRMKKKLEQLQEQLKDKANHIDQLNNILDKFQISKTIPSKYDKKVQNINVNLEELINQSNIKINQFYQLFNQIQEIEKQYQNIKKLLLIEYEKILQEKKQYLKQNNQLKCKYKKYKAQNQQLLNIIKEQKSTIQKLNELHIQVKLTIDELENQNATLTCALAETQCELQTYQRTARLVIQYYTKSKSQNLLKFYNFLQNQQLKQLLKPIITKK